MSPAVSAIRVLQVTGSLNVGGAEMMLLNALRCIPADCVSVDFLVFDEAPGDLEAEVRALGCRVLRVSLPRSRAPHSAVRTIAEAIRREGPYDVVHSHVNLASGMVMAAAHRAAVPNRIAHAHITSDDQSGLIRRVYRAWSRRWLRKYSTEVVACGAEAGRHLFGDHWVGRGVVIPNGVQVERFLQARSERASTRHELGFEDDVLLAGTVARLVAFKNHLFMLDAMAATVSVDDRVILLIVGDGPLRAELEGRAAELGIEQHVRFLGLRSDIPQLLSAMDVVLVTSHYEGLPVNLVEAQAAGTPALVSEGVTEEADLGLGLIRRLPISSATDWRAAILAPLPPTPSDEQIRQRFAATGYDAATTGRRLLALWGVDT